MMQKIKPKLKEKIIFKTISKLRTNIPVKTSQIYLTITMKAKMRPTVIV